MSETLYNVIYSQESEGHYNPFVDPSRMEVRQVTESELREMWEKSTHTQDQFGTFENYLAYTAEASDYLADTSWWDAEGIDTRTQTDIIRGEEDLGISTGQQDVNQLVQTDVNARQGAYQQWLMSDENQALMEKYGVEPTVYNDKGDEFTWTGSGYIRTVEVDEAGFADYAKVAIVIGIGYAAGPAIANALTPALGATGAAAAAAGIVSSATQLMLTGEVDPLQALTAAATAGLSSELFSQLDSSGVLDQVGQAENVSDLQAIVNEYAASGNYSAETIAQMQEIVDATQTAANTVSQVTDTIGSIADVYNVVREIMESEVSENNVVWDVGGTGTIEGELNEEGDFVFNPEDVGVVVGDYTLETEDSGGGGGGAEGGSGQPSDITEEPVVEPVDAVEEETVTEEELAGAQDPFGDTTADSTVEEEQIEDNRYVYNNDGTWTDIVTGETIYGPGQEGDQATEEEMAVLWETGNYSWGTISPVQEDYFEDEQPIAPTEPLYEVVGIDDPLFGDLITETPVDTTTETPVDTTTETPVDTTTETPVDTTTETPVDTTTETPVDTTTETPVDTTTETPVDTTTETPVDTTTETPVDTTTETPVDTTTETPVDTTTETPVDTTTETPVDTTTETSTTEDAGGDSGVDVGTGTEAGTSDSGAGDGASGGTGEGTGGGTGGGSGTGTGGGTGEGSGGQDGQDGKDGKDGKDGLPGKSAPMQFDRFMSGINYQVPMLSQIVQNPNVDYTAELNRIINQNSGMFSQ